MRLVVYPNGKYSGAGTHISVAIYLMNGKYDNELDWPANVTLTVTLLNRDSKDKDSIDRLFDCSTSIYDLRILDRVWNGSMAKLGVIHSRFASNKVVSAQVDSKHSYIKQDSLYFHVRCETKHESLGIPVILDYLLFDQPRYRNPQNNSIYYKFDRSIFADSTIYCGIQSCYQPLLSLAVDSI